MSERFVIVAELDASQRQIIEMLLLVHGVDVRMAVNGRELLTYLRDGTPDLVIAFTELPQLSGFDVARKVRGVKRLRHVPVILIAPESARLDDVRPEAQSAGADLVILRPVGDKNLGDRAMALIERSRAELSAGTSGRKRNRDALTPMPGPRPLTVGTSAPVTAASMLEPVSDGTEPDQTLEITQLRQAVAELTRENAKLKEQLTATGRSSRISDTAAGLKRQLEEASEQLEAYRRQYPELVDVKATGTFAGLFSRRKN